MITIEAEGLNAPTNGKRKPIRSPQKTIKNAFSNSLKKKLIKTKIRPTQLLPFQRAVKAGVKVAKFGKLAKMGKLASKAKQLLNTKAGKHTIAKIKAKLPLSDQDEKMINTVAVANDKDPRTPNIMPPAEFAQLAPQATQAQAPQVEIPPAEAQAVAVRMENIQTPAVAVEAQTQAIEAQTEAVGQQIDENAPIADIQSPEVAPQEQTRQIEAMQSNLSPEVSNYAEPMPVATKSNTMMYVVGALALGAAIYYTTKKK